MAAGAPFTERLIATCKCGYTVEEDFHVVNPHAPRPSHLRTRAEQAQYERSRAAQQPQPKSLSGFFAGIKERIYRLTKPRDAQSHGDEESIGTVSVNDRLKDPEILHFCVPKGPDEEYVIKYIEFKARPVSDQEFMERLRVAYRERKFSGFWRRFRWLGRLCIRRVRSLHFVRFIVLARNLDFAAISEMDSIPPTDDTSYVYSPKPPRHSIPDSERLLLHYFNNPSHCDSGLQMFSSTPRKLKHRVVYSSQWMEGVEGYGWGIQVRHCVNPMKLAMMWGLFISLLLGLSFVGVRKDYFTIYTAAFGTMFAALSAAVCGILVEGND